MDKERIEIIKKSGEIFKNCLTARGAMIDFSISTENILTDIITWCFFPTSYALDKDINNQLDEKGIIFKSLILRLLEFHEKIDVFEDVIQLTNNEIWNENKQLIREIRNLLDKIRRFRNRLAHSPLDTSDESIKRAEIQNKSGDRSFEILEYKKGRVVKHIIDENTIKLQIDILHRAFYKLLQLWALSKKDTKDAKACEMLASMSDEESHIVLKKMGLSEE